MSDNIQMRPAFAVAMLLTWPSLVSTGWAQAADPESIAAKCIAKAEQIAVLIPPGRNKEVALAKVIVAHARHGDYAPIDALANRITDDRERATALLDTINSSSITARNGAAAGAILQAALTSATRIQKAPPRDNLLWQIAYQQALNGQIEEARNTTKLIESIQDYDHALFQIASAQAQHNDIEAAGATAETIRPGNWREDAFAVVAGAAARVEGMDTARKFLEESRRRRSTALYFMAMEKAKAGEFESSLALAHENTDSLLQVLTLTKIGETAASKGNNTVTKSAFEEARTKALANRRGSQLHAIASAQAKAGLFDDALATVDDLATLPQNARRVMNGNDVVSALALVAQAQSKAGQRAEAQRTLDRALQFLGPDTSPALLEIVRSATIAGNVDFARSIAKRNSAKLPTGGQASDLKALQIIAIELARSGDLAGAAAIIGEIDETVGATDFSGEARGQLAVAQVKQGLVREAFQTVEQIRDPLTQVMALTEMARAQ